MIPATVLIILSELLLATNNHGIDHANITLPVAESGMGRDIWTVPPENITTMLKVRELRSSRISAAFGTNMQDHRLSTSPNTSTRSLFP